MASPRDRFFVEGVHVLGETVAFAPDDARKIATVLRGRSGERVQVVDSAGSAFSAAIEVGAGGVSATLEARLERGTREAAVRVVVAQAIPKGQKMDVIVEKATELGAAAFVPLRSERVAGERTGEHKVERWQRIAKAAAQQSGRTVVPEVAPVASWDDLLTTFAGFDRVYIPWELAEVRPLREIFEADAARLRSVLFVIGPEGGFSAAEVERATAAGATVISLGARILRTDTAALAILAVINAVAS